MRSISKPVFTISLVWMGVFAAGCGGGGGGSGFPADLAPRTLTWSIDNTYTDGSPYDPVSILKEFEIYVRQDNNFSPADPYVIVNAVDAGGHLVTSFDLRLAYVPLSLSKGVEYSVAIRVTTLEGVRSDFSPPGPQFHF